MQNKNDPLTGKIIPVFFHYAVPSVIGMLAATSAWIIDGIFIGNFVGAEALAAVTGVTTILSIGNKSPHTRCFTAYGTDVEIYGKVTESINHLAAAATPAAHAA